MSNSLPNTVALLGSAPFRERVKAAMTEYALTVASGDTGGPANPVNRALRSSLALSVLADTESRVDPFLRLVANDTVISGVTDPLTVADTDIRRVVAAMWEAVAVAVPNLSR